MQLDIAQYARKPFVVQGVQVTQENIHDVALWCDGKVINEVDAQFVKVDVRRPLHERQTKAYAGDWVLRAGQGFRVYNDAAFRNQFDLMVVDVRDANMGDSGLQDIQAVSYGPDSTSVVPGSAPMIVGTENNVTAVPSDSLEALKGRFNTI